MLLPNVSNHSNSFQPAAVPIPSLGHLFRLGAINLNTAQLFFRTVTVQMTVEIPLYNPAIHEEHDQRTPKEIMPAGWVFDGDEAV